ncbi:MAG: cytochrome c family protein, partial [Alphaproteobacteria bacterium]|nr:cytochrome c family protein [Alphaproteobacteria bacterium]
AADAASPLIAAIAAADVADGEKAFKKCKACHSVDEGGAHKVGPNIWDVVGAPLGRHADYKYSSALVEMGGTWDYASLDAFLAKPKDFMAGTKMAFPGVKKPEDRAAVIAYLRSNAAAPAPLTD